MSDPKNEHYLFRDFLGVTAIAITLYAIVSLMSYNTRDPSYNRHFSSQEQVMNQGGVIGAYIADGLVQTFGAGSFFFPVVTLLMGWALIRGKVFHRWPIVLGSGVLVLICLCALVPVHFTSDPVFSESAQPGGMVGSLLGGVLVLWLNKVGATLLLATLLFLSLVTMTGISVNQLIDAIDRGFRRVVLLTAQTALALSEKFRQWKAQRALASITGENKPKKSEPVIVTRVNGNGGKEKSRKKKKEEPEPFPVQEDFPFLSELEDYQVPPVSMLEDSRGSQTSEKMRQEIILSSNILEKKLGDFGIEGRVVQVLPGPVITLYEFEPAPGVKVSRILALTDDLALAMRAPSVRFLAPVPGKPVVGIEIPNPKRETVYLKEIMVSEAWEETNSRLSLAIGKDNIGQPVVVDLAQVPHLLIAGATGSGKSVGINAMICSILLNAAPDEVKLIMVDPKMLELSMYDGIPHLIAPVVTHPKKAAAALQWAVNEMEHRYKTMSEWGVRNIRGFNLLVEKLRKEQEEEQKIKEAAGKLRARRAGAPGGPDEASPGEEEIPPQEIPAKLPYVVIVIDELADLMMVASKGVEDSLARLAQMARAAGIHLIVATQRPSVDVLTGLIKANFPARISFQVTSRVDSRTILDSMGAEKLLGKGDMLFMPPGSGRLRRIHGAKVSDEEINRIIAFIKRQKKPEYKEEVFNPVSEKETSDDAEEEMDEKYDEAVALVAKERQASISMIQRKLRVGYNRAARMVEVMEKEGVVGPSDGIKPREVYVKPVIFD